jgi:type IV secretory pathway VirJ component
MRLPVLSRLLAGAAALAGVAILVLLGAFSVVLARDPRLQHAAPEAGSRLAALPLAEVEPLRQGGDAFVVYYSGDNGWQPGDKAFVRGLTEAGAPVVAVDSLRYFSKPKSTDQAARDLAALITRYGQVWRRPKVVLVGYSFGADALSVLVDRLRPDLRSKVKLVALIAPGGHGDLALRPYSLFDIPGPGARPILPALEAFAGAPKLCIWGADDFTAACPSLPSSVVRKAEVPGGHRFKGQYDRVASIIARAAGLGRV